MTQTPGAAPFSPTPVDGPTLPRGPYATPGPYPGTTGSAGPGPTTDPYGRTGGYPGHDARGPALPPLDVVSVVSVVTAVLGVTLVGLVTGVVGLSRTAGGRRRGRGLAVAGVVVSLLVAVVQVLVVVVAWPAFRAGFQESFEGSFQEGFDAAGDARPTPADVGGPVTQDGTTPEGSTTGAGATELVEPAALVVGHCFLDPVTEEFFEIEVVPCHVPHDGEVVALVELEGASWPGVDGVDDAAWDACLLAVADAFEATGVDGAGLEYWNFTPTRESWLLYGDRAAQCLAYDPSGQLTAPVLPPS